ncbi:MAG: GntR family transcriptional regulator [Bacillota bacterium]
MSASRAVYDALVAAILDGRLKPGTRLREASLASELGVSSTPLREALQMLVHDGLAEHLPGRGVRVVTLSAGDVEEIYDLRAVLEGLAVQLCARKATGRDLQRLEEVHAQSLELVKGGNLAEYRRCNLALHSLFVEIAGSRRLSHAMAAIRLQTEFLTSITVQFPGRPERAVQEHRRIIDAVRRGDGAEAERVARGHIERAKEELLAKLGASDQDLGTGGEVS